MGAISRELKGPWGADGVRPSTNAPRSRQAASRQRVEVVEESGDPAGIGLVHDQPGAARGREKVEAADALLHPRQGLPGHRQLPDAEADEERRVAGIAGDLAA